MPTTRSPRSHRWETTLDERLGAACAAWVGAAARHPGPVVLAFAALSLLALAVTAGRLRLDTDENDLFAEDRPVFAARSEFYREFPGLIDPVVVVVDADTADRADEAAEVLERRLAADPEHFGGVFRPGGGAFFERNGLLYLETEELAELADNLFAVQPYLGELSRDPSLRGLFGMLGDAADALAKGEFEGADLAPALERVADTLDAQLDDRPASLSWSEVIAGHPSTRRERRRLLLVEPIVDFGRLSPAETSLSALRELVAELGYDGRGEVRVRATGVFPLSYEEMDNVRSQTALAGLASFGLVALLLTLGLGSGRLVLASLACLLAGLSITGGFATLAIGHLNLLSVAFAVLFIGLSIDFAIHLCVGYREIAVAGLAPAKALSEAARSVGGSLVLCAATTAIGFLAFLPTDYVGVAELGAIAGAGMGIGLLCNLTLLPALLVRLAPPERLRPPRPLPRAVARLLAFPARHARAVLVSTAALGAISALALPRISFDPNPLRVRDPTTPSVEVMNELLADGDALLWNLNALAPDLPSALRLAQRLEALPSVAFTVTLADFVPDDQEAKRALLDDAAFVLLPTLTATAESRPLAPGDLRTAVTSLSDSLRALHATTRPGRLEAAVARTLDALDRLLLRVDDVDLGARLHRALVGTLSAQLTRLRLSLEPEPVALGDLPPELVQRMRSVDGQLRVEVFPAEDLNDTEALEGYVRSVREIAPDAFGEGLVILESQHVVEESLREALITAAAIITLLLLALWRSPLDAALVVLPLGLAALLTAGASVLLGVPLNFANVIVIPLMLGMGVDTGIHLVHRMRLGMAADGGLLRTSTARAVLLSALTTVASFGTLGFSSHLGMASLGQLLTLGMSAILGANLLVLPALARALGRA